MGKVCASALQNHLNVVRMYLNNFILYIQLIQPLALKNPPKTQTLFLTHPNFPPDTSQELSRYFPEWKSKSDNQT